MNEITVEAVGSLTDEVRALIGELDQTLAREYSAEQQHGLRPEAIFQPHVRFFLARLDGVAVGCGGVALFEDFAEVKRMYVRDSVRGQGIGRALLLRIESAAIEGGHDELRLETGDKQLAAIRLYERAGFQRCAAFHDYKSMAPSAIATSLFFEKHLTGTNIAEPKKDGP
ncbi:MAG TPA: GNAT family N-acetyltransferase [Candidatus Eremiobacteraceae bacterium]|nr:GNAT family N-acetyltransferase [Candidatus Eremiobacteraceae bacterium]